MMPGTTARWSLQRTMIGAMVSAVIFLWVLSSNHPFGLARALPIGFRGLVELAIILSACAAFVHFNDQKPLFKPLAAFGTNDSSVKHLWRKRDYVHLFGILFVVSLAVSACLVFNKSFIEHKFGMGFKEMVFKHIPHMKYGVAYRNWLAQSNFLYWFVYNFGGEVSQQGHADAQQYYESQRPYLQKAYAEFKLHKHYVAMRTAVQSYGPYAK